MVNFPNSTKLNVMMNKVIELLKVNTWQTSNYLVKYWRPLMSPSILYNYVGNDAQWNKSITVSLFLIFFSIYKRKKWSFFVKFDKQILHFILSDKTIEELNIKYKIIWIINQHFLSTLTTWHNSNYYLTYQKRVCNYRVL